MRESRSEASILHADLDAFYASVEQRDDATLRGKPVIVGAGVVLAASYEAKRHGVKTAMNQRQAQRLCPTAIVVPPRFEAYSKASRDVFEVFNDTTPLVEGLSIDEAFLDVSGLRRISGTPAEIGQQLRQKVADRVGLAITVGVARTKFLAKVASAVAKPDGLLVVPPDGETDFLHPLPVQALWGVGAATAQKLADRGLHTVADVARLREADLVSMLGAGAGRHLHALAHHRDPRPIEVGKRRRSVGSQQALGRSLKTFEELTAILLGIVDRVMQRLRGGDRLCRTVILRLRFDDYSRATRSRTMRWPTASTEPVLDCAMSLLGEARAGIEERGLTLLGLSVTNLSTDGAVQLTLPLGRTNEVVKPRHDLTDSSGQQRHEALDETLDNLKERFGASALTRASMLGKDRGFEMPKLPD